MNIDKLHTTPMGVDRIRTNLSLPESIIDVVEFCKQKILSPDCNIYRHGKNWYCEIDDIRITVNAYSDTIITAHKMVAPIYQPCTENIQPLHGNSTTDVPLHSPTGISHDSTASGHRPDFSEINSYEEFSKYYWYREELQKICKSLNIDASGMKAELNYNIEQYFKGNKIAPKRLSFTTLRPSAKYNLPLTLQTGLIECGFCFSQYFRDFFSQQTGIENFKFNVDMVATVKKVKETNDTTFTLGDLLDIYYKRKTYAQYDKVSLQWNKFFQDFCADPVTTQFKNKLKTASILWKEIRTSTREKKYTTDLLNEFSVIINQETKNAKTKN